MKAIEEKIEISSGRYPLEGLWQEGGGRRGVVITHPHPLYGGTMRNPVVKAIQVAYQLNGYATLRFDFRGVGGSQGRFDDGIGEQDDVRAAIASLQAKGADTVDLAGYSFGAWVNAGLVAAGGLAIASMLMVSPPVGFIGFENVSTLSCLKWVVTGGRDDIAPAAQIRDLLPAWNPNAQFEIIDGCDHFYTGYLDKLQSILTSFLQNQQVQ
jgi:alpha/beta superfamily hydrolase